MKTIVCENGGVRLDDRYGQDRNNLMADLALDDLTHLAAAVAQTPAAIIALLDTEGIRIASQVGLASGAVEFYLQFCIQTIKYLENHQDILLIVEDTLRDKSLIDQSLTSYKPIPNSPTIRFYTAFPLINPQGKIFGLVLAIDGEPRKLNRQQKEALKVLKRQANTQLALYTQVAKRTEIQTQEREYRQRSPKQILQKTENTSWERSQDLICVIGVDGYLKGVNSRFEKTLDYSTEEVLERLFWDFVHPEDRSQTRAELEKLTDKTSTVSFENRYRCKDGGYKWLSWNAFPLLEEEDMVYAIARDITKTKQRKASLLERSRVSTLEADIGAALVSQNLTLKESLAECTEAMIRHLHAIGAGIWTVEREAGNLSRFDSLELQSATGKLLPAELFPCQIAPNEGIIGAIAHTRKSISTCLSTPGNDKVPSTFLSGYPLIIDSQVVGVMALHSHQPFSQVVDGVLGWVANAIAVAIDRVWAREELLSRREALLFQLASQIRNSLELDTILETAVTEIRTLLRVDNCSFIWYFADPNCHSICVTHEARNPETQTLLGESSLPQSNPLVEMIWNLKPLRIADIRRGSDLAPEMRSLLTDWGIKSGLILPLKTQTGQLGAIICSNASSDRNWSDREVELLQGVVDQLAIAIEHAELFAKISASALAAQTQARQLETVLRDLRQTEALLIQTEKMSTIGQMLAGIAHEINNPVNFLTGNLLHAQNSIQDLLNLINYYRQYYPNPVPEIQEYIKDIELDFLTEDLPKMMSSMQMGADRINEIIVSLRNFSRTDPDEMNPADIHEGIDSTLLILRNRMKPCGNYPGITLIKEYGNLPPVECYIGQLNQVFMNIISNSIDALEELRCKEENTRKNNTNYLEPTIWIRTELLDNNQVVIRIRDNGPGIPKTILNRLFDPFFTTKPLGKGTGLGLSISQQIIVEKHGGVLECISEPGKGTEFLISIPLKEGMGNGK
ncbi:MAG TPA: PAS domain-containing protein [Cyanobacteria bacterium UBA11159]|nr:PAS domain-containing protein [Cyanobacteria bacterium UBA11367]HBE56864.1 PAS domain-containing protein [Cyanobacteria bacterium UBA11366]HBK63934.1 PAS domain-containing protein [Cyanobacteria bacterium UBA11166]HBR76062.1 PAS domain-containing protein [Cyanobacteria bacterium UBA11159]HBS72367.1 PAS domain-containing protein [Cyanobacteria bacterium UBA11153]HCA96894.1 PAS domain-containing protein [Cyanobacteria bacterium UBA9226]